MTIENVKLALSAELEDAQSTAFSSYDLYIALAYHYVKAALAEKNANLVLEGLNNAG